MISSNCILTLESVIRRVPLAMAALCAVVAVVAFIVGFAKGYRRVGWGCLTCLLATGAFVFLNTVLIDEKIVLKVNGKGQLGQREITTLVVALVCIVAALVLYGVLSLLLRPSYKIVHKNPVRYKYGIAIEDDEEEEYDGAPPRSVKWRNAGKPSFGGRLFGGCICAVNALCTAAIVLSLLVLVVSATSLNESVLSAAMDVKATKVLLDFAQKYALDFLTISLIVLTSFRGYKKGLVGSLRSLLVSFGGIVLSVIAFVLPFMNSEALFFTPKLVARCTALLGGVPETVRAVAGKLLSGVLIWAVLMVVLAIVNFVLNRLTVVIIRVKPIRMLDGTVACLLYFVLGVVICVGIWCVLYALEYCGLIYVSRAFGDKSQLSKAFFRLANEIVKPIIEKFVV